MVLVYLVGLVAFAGAFAVTQVVLQAHLIFTALYIVRAKIIITRAEWVQLLNKVEQRMHRTETGLGPKVFAAVFNYRPCREYTRKGFFLNAYPRVSFIVFKEYVIAGLQLFYEVVFQQ